MLGGLLGPRYQGLATRAGLPGPRYPLGNGRCCHQDISEAHELYVLGSLFFGETLVLLQVVDMNKGESEYAKNGQNK